MANPVLELKTVSKTFGSTKAVRKLSLVVHPGEIYGLIGPNGSGKTTTIKMICGIYRLSSGAISVQGFDIKDAPSKAKAHIGYIPDDPTAYERLTGREFLQFVGELFGMDRDERERKIEELLGRFRLLELAEGFFDRYSRGTKQKMSICAALLHDPALLLIDEPMVGLDPWSANVTKDLLKSFADRGGAVLLSTHTLSIADEICHRFGLIKKGKLATEGSKAELLSGTGMKSGSLEEVYLKLTAESS